MICHSSRDIQKKLSSLLPADYRREYRKYRPSNSANAQQRLQHFQRCRDDHVKKYRKRRERERRRRDGKLKATCEPRTLDTDVFEGPITAFRSHYVSVSADSAQCVSMASLDLRLNPNPSPFITAASALEQDGLLCPTSKRNYAPRNFASNRYDIQPDRFRHKNCPASPIVCYHTYTLQPFVQDKRNLVHPDSSISLDQKSLKVAPSTRHSDQMPHFLGVGPSDAGALRPNRLLETLSISSLESQLRGRHSQSSLEHIKSVLRLSLDGSWRSSSASLVSVASSVNSRGSTDSSQTSNTGISKVRLTKGEKITWNALVDLTKVSQSAKYELPPPEISWSKDPAVDGKTLVLRFTNLANGAAFVTLITMQEYVSITTLQKKLMAQIGAGNATLT
jgi:hypothetical protein